MPENGVSCEFLIVTFRFLKSYHPMIINNYERIGHTVLYIYVMCQAQASGKVIKLHGHVGVYS